MHSIITFITLVFAAVAAHPALAAAAAYLALSALNGALPQTVVTGPFGAVLHLTLDRLAVLVRRDAHGTLKLPLVASAVVLVADSLIEVIDPRPVPGSRVPTELVIPEAIAPAHVAASAAYLDAGTVAGAGADAVPAPAGSRAGSGRGQEGRAAVGALVVLCLVTAACSGGAAAAVGVAADTASSVILVARKVRAAVCAEGLDPYLGAVRERVVVVHDVALDAGAADGAVDGGAGE